MRRTDGWWVRNGQARARQVTCGAGTLKVRA